jgi:hypothetical protein
MLIFGYALTMFCRRINILSLPVLRQEIPSVVCWSEFLVTDPEVPGSISGATRFSEK